MMLPSAPCPLPREFYYSMSNVCLETLSLWLINKKKKVQGEKWKKHQVQESRIVST